jgi:hypothetical protein
MAVEDVTHLRGRVAALVGREVIRWIRATRGYTQAARFLATFDDGSSAFVKASTDTNTKRWLQTELTVYRSLDGDFMPRLLASASDESGTLLVLEDLSEAIWPPPWSMDLVDRVVHTLDQVSKAPAPQGFPLLADQRADLSGWYLVERDPAPFLSLRLCSPEWLRLVLPKLLRAEAAAELAGDALLHLDVRSDNICFSGDRTLLIDWNWASIGNPVIDLVAWLPSLYLEGGPAPEELYDRDPAPVAMIAGYWAARAGLPMPPHLARVREIQLESLGIALPWATRALRLPPPD